MRLPNKLLSIWVAVMWVIFSIWLFAVTQFPLNFGFVGLESIVGVVLMWMMLMYRDV